MDLNHEIADLFVTTMPEHISPVKSLESTYPASVIRLGKEYGVAIVVPMDLEVSERFTNVRLKTEKHNYKGNYSNLLLLTSENREYLSEFAIICSQFVDPGNAGEAREALLSDPSLWWKRWKELLGNRNSSKQPYHVIAEMLVLKELTLLNKNPVWSGPTGGITDISTEDGEYEVKSTIKRYDTTITASSQYQLDNVTNKPTKLVFARFDYSESGESINDLVSQLSALGIEENLIEENLALVGFERGKSVRNERFKNVEIRVYDVSDDFPKITAKSFKEDKIPDQVTQIVYTIDLNNIQFKTEIC
jgi:hypothetical protein